MLDIFQQSALSTSDFNQKVEWIIPNFLPKRMITMVYADGGNGKSWLGLAVAKDCAYSGMQIAYLDFDNPLTVLKERGVHEKLVEGFSNLKYVHRSKCPMQPLELLQQIAQNAVSGTYSNLILVIDSLRNFADVKNDAKTMQALNYLMDIREAGATILVLHHSNKDGKNYEGSNNIRNSVDNMFQLSKLQMGEGVGVLLKVKKERASINDHAFDICPHNLTLEPRDLVEAQSTEQDLEFVNDIKQSLLANPAINKTALLNSIGLEKDNKQARARLDKYDGVYWQSEKKVNRTIYTIVEQP